MEDNFYINLGDCIFESEELDVLFNEWLKDPQPKTINKLARMYLSHRLEVETGFLPYDRRLSYSKGDKITIRLVGEAKPQPAEVTKISKKTSRDSDGFSFDEITVHLLTQAAFLSDRETRCFIANYQGEKYAGPAVVGLQIITEQNESEVIPKILLAIANDSRFVNFREHWLRQDLLVANMINKLIEVRRIIAKHKHALSTMNILDKVYTGDNVEELGNRLEFSLNYFLSQDQRFVQVSDSVTKWDLRKPSGPVKVTIDKKNISGQMINTSFAVDLLLFYHGFIDQCVFVFPHGREISAYHNIAARSIVGEEFINELAKLSSNQNYKVKFGHPGERGDPIRVYVSMPSHPEKRCWTVTIKPEWLEKGVILVPRGLSNYMEGTNTVHILYDQLDNILPYKEEERLIEEIGNFYYAKAIAEYDKVTLLLQSLDPTELFVSSRWKRRLDRLLQINPTDLHWEHSSLRDCIIVVLAKFRTTVHYREIYSEIVTHKHVSCGAVIGTLSRYCPSVFVHAGWGKWQLVGYTEEEIRPKQGTKVQPEVDVINDEIWNAVAAIEDNDYVYKLLQKIRKPLSFDEICSRLADYLKVNVQGLRATGFLKADDERFRRLDDGSWALEELFVHDTEQEEPVEDNDKEIRVEETTTEDTSNRSRFWLLMIILLILLCSSMVAGAILIWLFFTGAKL